MKDITTKIQKWFLDNEPSETLLYHKTWWANNVFIRDRIVESLFNTTEAEVVGSHYSKSIKCPVIKTVYKGVEILWQYNFYDWQVMVKSPKFINLKNLKLYAADGDYFYYQGIPAEYQFKPYAKSNRQEFAINVYGELMDVWAFALELKKAIK